VCGWLALGVAYYARLLDINKSESTLKTYRTLTLSSRCIAAYSRVNSAALHDKASSSTKTVLQFSFVANVLSRISFINHTHFYSPYSADKKLRRNKQRK